MKKLLLLFIAILLLNTGNAQSVTRLIGVTAFQDSLWVFDSLNFNVIRRLGPTVSGDAITGMQGLARHPITGEFFIICKVSSTSTNRLLGKIDLLTGVVTSVGFLGDRFSSITFNSSGTLYGVTGDGASVSETLYIINTSDATTTLLTPLGNGADGEVICFNSSDNMIYHWSGNGTIVFEKVDTLGTTVTNIPIIGATNGETFGMVHVSGNYFIGSNINSRFQRWYSDGNLAAPHGATTPDDIRGTAFLTCPRLISGTAAYCVGDSTQLTMSIASTYQWYKNGTLITGATAQSYYASSVGHYNCMVSDACGTDSLAAGVVVVQNTLPIVALSGNPNLCSGSSTTLTGTGGGTRQWYMNGGIISGATATTYVATMPGVYNMIKTNVNGCKDSASVGITVVIVASPIVALGNDTAICAGASLILDAQNVGDGYVWNDMSTSQTLTVSASGTYSVTVTNSNNCSTSDAIVISINSLPTVTLSSPVDSICVYYSPITLTGSPSGGVYSGTGVTGSSFDPSVAGAGLHTIMYSYTDGNGCSGTDNHDIFVDVCTGINSSITLDNINVYPNPTSSNLNVNLNSVKENNVKISLYDVAGKLVTSQFVSGGKVIVLDFSTIENGVYNMSIQSSETISNRKIIVSK